ncbi:LysR family transcriptional regulator [Clostridium estertheticum]|uniref:LysR family transcriptional regulator n=1 Tax=Clostridium estertheticum TaxID=238834 RepID=UPI0013EE70B5|nr:LysR family transcriptional regulator [Clostridium estertheticum]MBZ9608835.1 LysR family transcriptional regulator [Clostridium estertheticum]
MEIRQLNTFITVADLNSFTRAAYTLGYTQPTVTSQIQLLESDLGVRLFERIRKNISLTHEGEKFIVYARQIVNLCEEAKNAVKDYPATKGVLTIGAWESLCTTRIDNLLKKFHYKFPDIEIILKTIKSTEYQELLLDNQIDVAFCLERMITSSDFIVELAIPEPLVLLAEPNHPLAKFIGVYPENIVDYTLILAEEGCSYRRTLMKILSDCGLTPKSIMEIGSIQSMKQLAIGGLGIIVLPKITVEEELSKGQLVELKWCGPYFEFLTQVIYHKDKWVSPALQTLLNMTKIILPMQYCQK